VRRPAVVPTSTSAGEALLHRALAATTSGVTIADMTRPDSPLMYVNSAFETLTGLPRDQLLGRNCRFLQGSDTDAAAVSRIRAAVVAGQECRETLLNYRGADRTPWWNELFLTPVTDEDGRVVQYIGVQDDVTARIESERALLREGDRAQSYLARIEQLAHTDPLTGLANRRRLEERVEAALLDARLADGALALLCSTSTASRTSTTSRGTPPVTRSSCRPRSG
jgi:PAS domain S-box-containing protein